ncbi:acyltransferase domain-containing protein [Kitasatospora sp. NPDC002227]|uniref:acyltransferase domain-containing protein n=1 Tax=Kitasatospora sp. NPDC002227 TaxID=3154773 RepID=UPI00331DCE74
MADSDIARPTAGVGRGSTIHLFPGQGDFSLAALQAVLPRAPLLRAAVAEVFTEADPVGGEFGVSPLGPRLLGRAPPSSRELAEEAVGTVQFALYGVSLAIHHALSRSGRPPDGLLAVSFGEIAALVAAGSLPVADGARLACRLGLLLHGTGGGMTLLQASVQRAQALLCAAAAPEIVLACVNDAREVVISGPLGPLREVEQAAERAGLRAQRLRLPFLAHHPRLRRQAETFTAFARALPLQPPRLPVYSAVTGAEHTDRTDLAQVLGRCLTDPADLPAALRLATRPPPGQPTTGPPPVVPVFLEAGTGQALTTSVRRQLPAAQAWAPLADRTFPWPDRLPAPIRARPQVRS